MYINLSAMSYPFKSLFDNSSCQAKPMNLYKTIINVFTANLAKLKNCNLKILKNKQILIDVE